MNQKQIIINLPSFSTNTDGETTHQNNEWATKLKKLVKPVAITVVSVAVAVGVIWAIGGFQASQSALNYANLTKSEVTRLSFDFDMEGFTPTYEVEWYNNMRKQEYTVHAFNGNILKVDWD